MPFAAFRERAEEVIAGKQSETTRAAYTFELGRWLAWCEEKGLDPADVPIRSAVAYRAHLTSRMADVSARRALAALSSVYAGLGVEKNAFHPRHTAWPPAPREGRTQVVDDDVADAMITAAEERAAWRDHAILRVLYDTGLRRASVATLRRRALRRRKNGAGGEIKAVVKGGHEVDVELPAVTLASVERWLSVAPPGPFLFSHTDRPPHPSNINRVVVRWAKAVGVEDRVHPHRFRAAFITTAYDEDIPEARIQAAAHHSDRKMTQRYDRGRRATGVVDAVAAARERRRRGR
jgi:integrase